MKSKEEQEANQLNTLAR